jgi:broad specificity phosphatase PhoE
LFVRGLPIYAAMSRSFIVVRHSERLDEVAPEEWLNSVKNNRSSRDRYSLENDTPITAAGASLAADAAKTVKSILSTRLRNGNTTKDLNIRIYSSRLMRCVQTAYQIAQELGLPIHLSSGLSLTAVAVGRRKTTFQFQSLDELSALCPGVQLHCSDADSAGYPVSKTNWLEALHDVVSRDEINIIVAHRETIRNLVGERIRLPYCCIGMFLFHGAKIYPHYLWDKDGRVIEDYLLPLPDMTTVGAITAESIVEGEGDGYKTP